MKFLPKAVNENRLIQELEKELLVYDLKNDKAYSLNETATAVYKACDGKTDFKRFAAEHSLSEDLVFFTLDELRKKNLIADEDSSSPFAGMSRRDVIRKVGVGTMAVLPVILMLNAPVAAQTASCTPEGSPCVSTKECCPNPTSPLLCFEFPAGTGAYCRPPIPS